MEHQTNSNARTLGPIQSIQVRDTLAEIFVDNRLSDVHPSLRSLEQSFANMSRLSDVDTLVVIGKVEETPEMIEARRKFRQVVERYEKKTGTQYLISNTNSDDQQWWSDLIVSMEGILVKYQSMEDGKSFKKLRKCLRKCADLKRPVNHWLKLLPSESWQASLVCGGIKIIFAAAAKLEDVREDIANAIQQIPVAISRAQEFTSRYTQSELLTSHVSQLYVAVLDVLQHCLSFFMQSPSKRAMTSILKGDGFGMELADKLKHLQLLETSVDKVADMNLHKSVGDANSSLDVVHEKLNVTYWEMKKLERMVKGSIEVILLDQQDRFQRCQEREQRAMLQAERKRKRRLRQSREAKDHIQDSLMVDVERHSRDIATTLRDGHILSHSTQKRAAWIQESPEFSDWLSAPTSSILVVNSNEAQHSRQSAVSFFSASVVCGLEDYHAGLQISWFGGQNIHATASDIASDLLYQVLESGLEMVPTSLLQQASIFDTYDLEHLRDVLVRFLHAQLSETSVFIVLDSVSFYEDWRRRQDLHKLLNDFELLMTSLSEGDYPLKILISSPTHCRWPGGDTVTDSAVHVLDVPSVASGIARSANVKHISRGLIQATAEEQEVSGADSEELDAMGTS